MNVKIDNVQCTCFYNNSEVYSYLYNNYTVSQQATNFITTPNWKMGETFELPTKHDMLQNIVYLFIGHPFSLST